VRTINISQVRTIDGFALGEVVVLLARQEGVPVASDNSLNVAGSDVEEETLRHVEISG
jgi:hypothetical protein